MSKRGRPPWTQLPADSRLVRRLHFHDQGGLTIIASFGSRRRWMLTGLHLMLGLPSLASLVGVVYFGVRAAGATGSTTSHADPAADAGFAVIGIALAAGFAAAFKYTGDALQLDRDFQIALEPWRKSIELRTRRYGWVSGRSEHSLDEVHVNVTTGHYREIDPKRQNLAGCLITVLLLFAGPIGVIIGWLATRSDKETFHQERVVDAAQLWLMQRGQPLAVFITSDEGGLATALDVIEQAKS